MLSKNYGKIHHAINFDWAMASIANCESLPGWVISVKNTWSVRICIARPDPLILLAAWLKRPAQIMDHGKGGHRPIFQGEEFIIDATIGLQHLKKKTCMYVNVLILLDESKMN